ncbi:MAG: hypothetical protein QXU18_09630 [Thermoplasmatales archaeon]
MKRFYLIQNEEDESIFSGKLHTHVGKSYELLLEKIVINEYLIQRFNLVLNSKIKIGIDVNLFKITNPINKRDRKKYNSIFERPVTKVPFTQLKLFHSYLKNNQI